MYGPIIFSAYKNTLTDFPLGHYITGFTEFLTNVGGTNCFILSDGTFITPRRGVYEFSVSVYHWAEKKNILAVEKNHVQVIKFQENVDNPLPDLTLTFNWYMELEKNDKVRLKVVGGNFHCGGDGSNNCIFNGRYI